MVYYPKEMSRRKHLISLVALAIGSLAFLLFIEWDLLGICLRFYSHFFPSLAFGYYLILT